MSRRKAIRIGVVGVPAAIVLRGVYQDAAKAACDYFGQPVVVQPLQFPVEPGACDALLIEAHCQGAMVPGMPFEVRGLRDLDSRATYDTALAAIKTLGETLLLTGVA